MPGDLIGEGLAAVIRVISRFIFELLFQGVILGTGWFVIRLFCRHCEPGELSCTLVGLLFWAMLGVGLFYLLKS